MRFGDLTTLPTEKGWATILRLAESTSHELDPVAATTRHYLGHLVPSGRPILLGVAIHEHDACCYFATPKFQKRRERRRRRAAERRASA